MIKDIRVQDLEQKRDVSVWKRAHYRDLCCEKAMPGRFCVCRTQLDCPDHGTKCVGTHD